MENINRQINNESLYHFISGEWGSLQDGYKELIDSLKESYPNYIELVEAYPLHENFKKFEQWFDELTLKEDFQDTEAVVLIPYMTSEGEVILNVNLSSWWSEEDPNWSAADECTIEFYDSMYDGLQKICMEERPIGNYFSVAMAVLFAKWYFNQKDILSKSGQDNIYLAISNYGEIITFGRLTTMGFIKEMIAIQ